MEGSVSTLKRDSCTRFSYGLERSKQTSSSTVTVVCGQVRTTRRILYQGTGSSYLALIAGLETEYNWTGGRRVFQLPGYRSRIPLETLGRKYE